MRRKGNPRTLVAGSINWCSHCGKRTELPCDPGVPLLDTSLEKTLIWKDKQLYDYVYYSIVYNSQGMETTQMSINDRMGKYVIQVYVLK